MMLVLNTRRDLLTSRLCTEFVMYTFNSIKRIANVFVMIFLFFRIENVLMHLHNYLSNHCNQLRKCLKMKTSWVFYIVLTAPTERD